MLKRKFEIEIFNDTKKPFGANEGGFLKVTLCVWSL